VVQLLREQAEAADLRDLREARVGAPHFALDQHAYARMLGERAEVRERDALRLGPFRHRVEVDLDPRRDEAPAIADDDALAHVGGGARAISTRFCRP
jgi:hypothetical protein